MKSYIIFTPDIADLGGAQLYVLRRAKYLLKTGYKVKIITTSSSPLMLTEFSKFEILTLSINTSYKYILPKKRDKLINEIINFIGGGAKIIESHTLNDAIICEIIATRLNSKHIIYLLSEVPINSLMDKTLINYFEFKLKRMEIFGITNQSLSIVFGRELKINDNNYVNVPFDVDEFSQDTIFFFPEIKEETDFIIATIARLEKNYVIPFIESVYNFAKNKKFRTHLIVYGDSKYSYLKSKLLDKFKNINNLNIYFPGYLTPMPKLLLKKIDVFVGMGTSVINSISQGCPTLVVDPRTNRCAGILGRDVFNFGYPENHLEFSFEDKLDEIKSLTPEQIVELKQISKTFFLNNYELNIVMTKFDKLIDESSKKAEYWRFGFQYSLLEKIYMLLALFNINLQNGLVQYIKSRIAN